MQRLAFAASLVLIHVTVEERFERHLSFSDALRLLLWSIDSIERLVHGERAIMTDPCQKHRSIHSCQLLQQLWTKALTVGTNWDHCLLLTGVSFRRLTETDQWLFLA